MSIVQINPGEASSFENPTLDIYLSRGAAPFTPSALSFEIWSTPDGGPDAQTFPAGGGRHNADLVADKLDDGRFVADWLVDLAEPVGNHELRWFFTPEAGDAEQPFTETFIVGAPVVASASTSRGYCTIQDCRDEGISAVMVDDQRLASLIESCSAEIDSYCRWWFEPRLVTTRISGRGIPRIYTDIPVIRIDALSVSGSDYDVASFMAIEGAPRRTPVFLDRPGIESDPNIESVSIPVGRKNVTLTAVMGFTEDDGSKLGRTPLEIRRACIMLVSKRSSKIALSDDNVGQVTQIRTKTQAVTWADRGEEFAPFTGFIEVDNIIKRYRRKDIGVA